MAVQLQYVQLIMDKTNTADLSTGVFTNLSSATWTKNVQNSLLFHKFCQNTGKHWHNKGSTELYCLFIAAVQHLTPLVLSGVLFCDSKTSVLKSGSGSGRIWVPKSGHVRLRSNLVQAYLQLNTDRT